MINLIFFMVITAFIVAFPGCRKMSGSNQIKGKPELHYRIMFYNVENLFDLRDDQLTNDDDFTPEGNMHWSYKRYMNKLNNLSQVILATGDWRIPDVIGVCEVENKEVLEDLINDTPLSKFAYNIVHFNSPDLRGIDVAMIFNKQTVKILNAHNYPVKKYGLTTRDILYVQTLLHNDTCHFFINHWPSRSTGQLETEKDRFAAAKKLKHLTDSLLNTNSLANVLIMGDFNDEPEDESLKKVLAAQTTDSNRVAGKLYNISIAPSSGVIKGTLKYQGQWNLFDQIIVSSGLLISHSGLMVNKKGFNVLQNLFLLEPDEAYNGFKPFRTYSGFKYKGGFSDHLPVFVDLQFM